MIVEELIVWLNNPEPTRFPYDSVLAEYHRMGKHFVSDSLLKMLALSRKVLLDPSDSGGDTTLLREFLRCALDKWDGCYEYTTYLALRLLPTPTMDDTPGLVTLALKRRDWLVLQLVADEINFELAFSSGHCELLPEMRPSPSLTTKRCRLAVQIVKPALQRLGLVDESTPADPYLAACKLCVTVLPILSTQDRRMLQLSMLPVYTIHDEYLFIRVLQAFEVTFALLAIMLCAAIRALSEKDCKTAISHISLAESALHEAAPLFSLLATMQPEAFRTFRKFTEGASAIQSRNYKIVEALCSKPDAERLNSAAYFRFQRSATGFLSVTERSTMRSDQHAALNGSPQMSSIC
ncbi:tryptophan 2,3-dioxygenase [Ktedonosporobacter rubrisoli]|uniref:Tryptophan 2,3-dioxygenase n=1 Tax=Ktedonosporobacter rubrisoli TaxID=2509675 RepID=A0A4P6JPN8_KTERU|nr:tryptophan 2,3-dioxygenase family protein [Ktedonosporobacter rubrisoli]QBD77052.1 tryptophan 2,3-dioxygenase [Ktedonosporobacter rubrisoli]